MDEAILHRLSHSRDLFLKYWFLRMREAGFLEMISSRMEDSIQAFDALMATLRWESGAGNTSPSNSPGSKPESGCQWMIEEGRRHRARGLSSVLFLSCLKTMYYAISDMVELIEVSAENKAFFLEEARRTFDRCELAILADWHDRPENLVRASLEQANRQLTREKNNYRIIFNATTNLIMMSDGAGVIVEANPQANAFFRGREIIGRTLGELLEQPIPPRQELIKRTRDGTGTEVSLRQNDYEQVFNLRLVPLSKLLPENQGALIILDDITRMVDHRQALERTVAERTEALSASEKMLRTIFQSVGKGILLLDQDREIVRANQRASEIYGVPPEVLIGTDFCSLIDEEGCTAFRKICGGLRDGQSENIEITSCYVDGRQFPCQVTVSRIDSEQGPLWPLVIWDISAFKALEERLRHEKNQSEEMNLTLRNVLKTIESDRKEFEQRLVTHIRTNILPALAKIEKESSPQVRASFLDMLREQLISMTTGFENAIDADLLKLSKTELRICRFLQAGCSSKEICDAMNLAFDTIQTHRKNIRKKLGLRGKDVNLHAYLANRHLGEP